MVISGRLIVHAPVQMLLEELDEAGESDEPREGDYMIWDPRLAHTTGERSDLNWAEAERPPASAGAATCAQQYVGKSQSCMARAEFASPGGGDRSSNDGDSGCGLHIRQTFYAAFSEFAARSSTLLQSVCI